MIDKDKKVLRYSLAVESTHQHLFQVTLTWFSESAGEALLAMPAWAPGSYMIRNFARHVVKISAKQGAKAVALRKHDKDTWALEVDRGEVEVCYSVYAADSSVRGAYLDQLRGFVNGPAVFMRPLGVEGWPCRLEVSAVEGWGVYTTMPVGDSSGVYEADNYHALIDYPLEFGDCETLSFDVAGVPHKIVLSGAYPDFDRQRLLDDVAAICRVHVERFHGADKPPFDQYLFFLNITQDGYGGLEHRDSTALVCSIADLPPLKMGGSPTPKYRQLLGLFSHEYFHVWNVKRIAPRVLQTPDYQREVHTELLWSFEGITSYFDDYTVFLAGCISKQEYLQTVGEIASRVERGAGKGLQTVAESSFDAWTRFYLQDANSPNTIVSYYAKGALLALCLDLRMRLLSNGECTLEDLMRRLWGSYCATGGGLDENDVQAEVAASMAECGYSEQGVSLAKELDTWVHSRRDLPLQELLQAFGVDLQWRPPYAQGDKGGKGVARKLSVWLGAEVSAVADGLKLSTVHSGGAAERAGLMAGDVLVALAGRKASVLQLEACMAEREVGDVSEVHYFRDSVLHMVSLSWQALPNDRAELSLIELNGAAFVAQAWLMGAVRS